MTHFTDVLWRARWRPKATIFSWQSVGRRHSTGDPCTDPALLFWTWQDGLAALERLREWYNGPIVIISATDQEQERVRSLDLGADDYMTKPFSTSELAARVRASIRRAERLSASENSDTPVVCAGDIEIDLTAHIVRKGSNEVRLTRTEYELIHALATHSNKVLTHRQLVQTVWGLEYGQEIENLRTFIKQLRRKLEAEPSRPRHIRTEPGVGYRLMTA